MAQQPTSIAAPAATAAPDATSTNLIQNGSFESPSIWQSNLLVEYDAGSMAIPGWTVGGNSIDLVGENYFEAEDGDQSIDLSGSAPGSVSQTVATTAGANYTLTWYMAGNTNCGQAIKTMDVYWDGTLVDAPTFNDTGDSNTSMGWVQLQLNVTATGSSSVVEFADATPDMSECGATLDNVSLVPAVIVPPVFTEDGPPLSTLAGTPYSAIFFATGAPAYSLTGAPSWLSITPFGAVTGTPPAGTTSFSYGVSASNADGQAQAGPFTVTVQSAAAISGNIVDGGIANNPVVGSVVQACVTGGEECQDTTSAAGGAYSVNAPVGSSVVLTAFPLPGTADVATSTNPLTLTAAGIKGETISLDGLKPLPSGLQINGTSAPTIYWADPSTATLAGCPNGLATVSVIGQNTQTGLYTANVIPLAEQPPGSGNYTGVIPPEEPVHGPVEIDSANTCAPQSALLPSTGPATGGTDVLLTGSGLTGATGVSFGSSPATSFTVLSDHGIDAVAPSGSGTVTVTVTVGGTSVVIGQYTYMAITSVSPGSGPSAGGTNVVITGTGLGSAQTVLFGSTAADFTQVSDTQIDAVSPSGTGTVNITVDTQYGGETPVSRAGEFTYTSVGTTALRQPAGTAAAAVHVGDASLTAMYAQQGTDWGSLTFQQILDVLYGYMQVTPFVPQYLTAAADAEQALAHPSCTTSQTVAVDAATIALAPVATALAGVLQAGALAGLAALLAPTGVGAVATEAVETFLDDPAVEGFLSKYVFLPAATWLVRQAAKAGIKVAYAIFCNDSPQDDADIDPSGTVLDTNGNPVNGATVTILRAATSAGPYSPVSTAEPGIEPATNPETTAADGVFHWEVDAGWYEVQASAPTCTNPANSAQSTVTIGPYPVPPPQVGLTITLACANEPAAPVPTVTSLSQDVGPPAGGTTLTVLGTGFTPSSIVTFGGAKAQSVTYLSPQALTVTAPAGTGQVDVRVQTSGGTSGTSPADRFLYGVAPTVTRVSPRRGPADGGTVVRIRGTGFTDATAVSFGATPAASFTVESDTVIIATAPADPSDGTVDIMVINPAGASTASRRDRFTYYARRVMSYRGSMGGFRPSLPL